MSTRASYVLVQKRVCKQERMPRCASGERDCCASGRPCAANHRSAISCSCGFGRARKKLEACRFVTIQLAKGRRGNSTRGASFAVHSEKPRKVKTARRSRI